ncbi:MAG: 4-hydroxy-tetrahydrodipicolinate reductase [Burkholderiales bacterium]|jgi:4-hydroxy-tetrahydrodipicolinate reductase|nr:4-hydroxy-tetrahydrodipicolinate reductase [Burkholderiales bacterium]
MGTAPLTPIRVAVAGAGGRMGQMLIEGVLTSPSSFELTAALELKASPLLGRDAGAAIGRVSGVLISDDVEAAAQRSEVLIDFTRPEGTLRHARCCAEYGCAIVVGTTGLSEADKAELASLARRVPMVVAANMSVGVNVMLKLVRLAAQRLSDYDIEIVEIHHKHKVDAPSGTALCLGEAAAEGAGTTLTDAAVYAREGICGERRPGTIGFATLRGGDVVGEHTVLFCGEGERVELTHRAGSRRNFAVGALRAAQFVAERHAEGINGVYTMEDVLGLTDV